MKLTTFLLIIALVQASAKGYSQITLHEKNAPFEKVMQSIKKQTGYAVFYDESVKTQPISIDINNASVQQTLDKCFTNLPITYRIVDNNIFLKARESKMIDKIKSVLALPITISGKIIDEGGNPLAGVTISIQGTGLGAIADDKGEYKVTVEPGQTLVFKLIGYQPQLYLIKGQTTINVTLIQVATKLTEVVINKGYYTEKQTLSTGNVSTVSGDDIVKAGVNNPILALEGRVPGVYIAASSGLPGSTFGILLRGKNSFLNGSVPLFLIDGVPFDSGSMSKVGSAAPGGISPFASINPADIEQIDVLKDADATAIYGSRGANGVILITTKKGKAGTTAVDFDLSSGYSAYPHFVELLNTQQYLLMRNEAFKNDNAVPRANDYDVNGTWNKNSNTDWQNTLLGGTAKTYNAQLRVSGGSLNTQFSINGGYRRQTLVYTTSGQADEEASLRATITHTSENKKFNLNMTIGYVSDNNKLPITDLTTYIRLAPDAPALYLPNGNLNWANSTWVNPLAALNSTTQSLTSNLLGNLTMSYKLLTGLYLKASAGYNNIQLDELNQQPSTYFDPAGLASGNYVRNAQTETSKGESWIVEPQIQYEHNLFGGKFSALIGSTFQDKTNSSFGFITSGGFTSDQQLQNVSIGTNNKSFQPQGYADYRYNAIYSRINYNWQDKYVVNLTARRDGSTRFGPGMQFGDFGALGAAWIFSKEDWFKKISWLSFGKLRTSYGITGNDQIPDYQYLGTYFVSNPYGNGNTLAVNGLSNPDLHWEVNKKAEAGVELGFFNDRLNLSVSYYLNRTGNQLVSYSLPTITGNTTVSANLPAVIQNTGLEFTLSTTNIKTKDLRWSTNFNLTIPRNKWISFDNLAQTPYANRVFIGKSLFVTNQYRYTGIDPLTGVYTYQDVNQDNQLSASDYTQDKEISQRLYGGFNNSFSWKGLQIDIFFQFVKQTGKAFQTAFTDPGLFNPANSNQPVSVLGRWQNPGDVTTVEKFTQATGPVNTAYNNYALYGDNGIVNTSFIRLKSTTLSYSLPIKWITKIGIKNAQFYVQGQNLFTLTPYVGADPETGGAVLPPLRTLGMGLKVTL